MRVIDEWNYDNGANVVPMRLRRAKEGGVHVEEFWANEWRELSTGCGHTVHVAVLFRAVELAEKLSNLRSAFEAAGLTGGTSCA